MAQGSLRRQTLLRNTGEHSKLRKSILVSDPRESFQSFMEVSDDESERSKRRSTVEVQKRLSNIHMQDHSTNASINYNESYVNEQFVLCSHLFTENKITSKNVWKVQIINMLKPLCQQPGKDSLQVAGTSIDISAKVYSIRVDDVYSDGLKLASSLARTAQNEQENENGDDVEETEQECNARKMKKKKKVDVDGKKNTIVKNVQSLIGSISKLEPVDFSSRVKADNGTIDNLFTNILKEDNLGTTFILDDNSRGMYSNVDVLVKNTTKTTIDLKNLPQMKMTSLKICIPFNHFEIDDWDPASDKTFSTDKTTSLDAVVLDKNGFPIPELDGSIHDIFENNDHGEIEDLNDDYIQSMHEEIAPQLRGDVAKIVNFTPINDTTQVSEYSYNLLTSTRSGKFIDQIWAGPSHWKLKFIRKSGMRFSGQKDLAKECNKGRKKTMPEMIDFTKNIDLDLSQQLVIKRKRPVVDDSKITLPIQDLSCVKFLRTLNELILKPGVCPLEKKHQNEIFNHDVSTYKYQNPNDSLYCPEQNCDDGEDMDHENGADDNLQGYLDGNLLDAPAMIANSHIPYALKAKKMDMKRLKTAVWQELTGETTLADKKVQNPIKKICFSELYKCLPGLLSHNERDELSCPLAFVALLHLCNEQNLHLLQHMGYKDFDIQSAG